MAKVKLERWAQRAGVIRHRPETQDALRRLFEHIEHHAIHSAGAVDQPARDLMEKHGCTKVCNVRGAIVRWIGDSNPVARP